MHKLLLRPLRLLRIKTDKLAPFTSEEKQPIATTSPARSRPVPGATVLSSSYNPLTPVPTGPLEYLGGGVRFAVEDHDATDRSAHLFAGEAEAQNLLKRAPHSYLFNQMYGLWFFISWFLLTVIITHSVTPDEYGVFAIVLTAYNTILY